MSVRPDAPTRFSHLQISSFKPEQKMFFLLEVIYIWKKLVWNINFDQKQPSRDYPSWIRLKIILCESQSCLPIPWSTKFKLLNLALSKWSFFALFRLQLQSIIYFDLEILQRFWERLMNIHSLANKSGVSRFS